MNELMNEILMKEPEKKLWFTFHREALSKEKFEPVTNSKYGWVKPRTGGLWACLEEEIAKWQEFLKGNPEKFDFKEGFYLKPDAKIVSITSRESLKTALSVFKHIKQHKRVYFDFEAMATQCDGLYVRMWKENLFMGESCYLFYGWDIGSLLLLNYDIIDNIIQK